MNFGPWVGLNGWGGPNIGKQVILRTLELGNIGKPIILRIHDPEKIVSQPISRIYGPRLLISDCNVWGRIHFGNLFLEKWPYESWMWGKNKHFSENGSPGQTTMLTRRAAKFCVEPRSPFSEISHQESNTIGTPPNIVSWPECQPEFPKWRRRRFPKNSLHLVLPWEHHAQEPDIPCGDSLNSIRMLLFRRVSYFVCNFASK